MKRKFGHILTCDKTNTCECQATAFHEAGHALMAWYHDIEVLKINTMSRNALGETELNYIDDVITDSIIDLSGPIAERIVTKQKLFSWIREPEILSVIKKHGIYRAYTLYSYSKKILIDNWNLIEAIANEILLRGVGLSKSRFYRIIQNDRH